MRILGAIFVIVGLLLSISILGAFVGIPMILVGIVLLAVGGRRPSITNVVQVANNTPGPQFSMADGKDRWTEREPEPRVSASYERPAPRLSAPQQRAPQPAEPDFEIDYEDEEFRDVRNDLSSNSKRVLAQAKEDGYELRARSDRIVLKKGAFEETFRSNHAISEFAKTVGYG